MIVVTTHIAATLLHLMTPTAAYWVHLHINMWQQLHTLER